MNYKKSEFICNTDKNLCRIPFFLFNCNCLSVKKLGMITERFLISRVVHADFIGYLKSM